MPEGSGRVAQALERFQCCAGEGSLAAVAAGQSRGQEAADLHRHVRCRIGGHGRKLVLQGRCPGGQVEGPLVEAGQAMPLAERRKLRLLDAQLLECPLTFGDGDTPAGAAWRTSRSEAQTL